MRGWPTYAAEAAKECRLEVIHAWHDDQITQLVVVQNKSKLSVVAVLPTSHRSASRCAILAAMEQETIAARRLTRTASNPPLPRDL